MLCMKNVKKTNKKETKTNNSKYGSRITQWKQLNEIEMVLNKNNKMEIKIAELTT